MSDWDDWGKLLGGPDDKPDDQTESSGGSSEPDKHGRKGTIVIRRKINKKKTGRSIFEIFIDPKTGFAPQGAEIVSLEVEGFVKANCSDRKMCAEHAKIPAGTQLLKPAFKGAHTFEPADHDNGVLSKLIEICECGKKGEKSYKVFVEVNIKPEPTPPQNMRFSICHNCGEIED